MNSFQPLDSFHPHIAAKTRMAKGMTAKHVQVSISREKSATFSLQKKMAKSGEVKMNTDMAVSFAMAIDLIFWVSIHVLSLIYVETDAGRIIIAAKGQNRVHAIIASIIAIVHIRFHVGARQPGRANRTRIARMNLPRSRSACSGM
jgi:hypothetical protein